MDKIIKNTKLYSFKRSDSFSPPASIRLLLCPKCGEKLTQMDIENYSRCPFCNYRFELNVELEDFILEPIAGNWMNQQPMIPNLYKDEESVQILL